jgi:3-oxoacyl-[acyl-carrier protein] reductase
MKIALITGASGVIGTACAKALANRGYALALQFHRHAERVQTLLQALSDDTPVLVQPADITQESDVSALFTAIQTCLGHIDLLVNCAGVALPQTILSDVTESEMDLVYSVNVKGAMLLTKAAIPHMLMKEGGAIIHISSLWGITGGSCEAVYSASKGALNAFVKAMAKELAPSRIRVNAVAPGLVPSPMNAALSEQDLESFRQDTPLGQLVAPEQVAEAVCYLADAQMVTGQILSVDGGIVI